MDLVQELKKRSALVSGNIALTITPVDEQSLVVVGEHWTLYFVSGNTEYDNVAWRQFKTQLENKFGEGTFELTFERKDNLASAYKLAEEIKTTFASATAASLKVEDIRERRLNPDEPVLVVIAIWKIITRQDDRR